MSICSRYIVTMRNRLIREYFSHGLAYDEIIAILQEKHGIQLSLRHLKRLLRTYGLSRRIYSDIAEVKSFIKDQLQGSGRNFGYRWMHLKCIQAGYRVARDAVAYILSELDPIGVSVRRKHRLERRRYASKGPNYIWHLDSYVKLKPFGMCINGCIDGFSRKIMWLKLSASTSCPQSIAYYFVEAATNAGGIPTLIRADMGTENGHVAAMQTFLRRNAADPQRVQNSFIYGTSQHNQRIECWWSQLRKHCTEFWITFFRAFKECGVFTGDVIDKSLLQICFMDVLEVRLP